MTMEVYGVGKMYYPLYKKKRNSIRKHNQALQRHIYFSSASLA